MSKTVREGIKITLDTLADLRKKVAEARASGMKTLREMARSASIDYPAFSLHTLQEYLGAVDSERTSDYVFKLVMSGTISINLFNRIAQGDLDMATKDSIAREVVQKGLTPRHVRMMKQLLKKGRGTVSFSEALMRSTGKIPLHAKGGDIKKSMKVFGGVIGDAVEASLHFMTKLQTALDVLPGSALESGEAHMELFEKLATFEVSLENAHRFVVDRRKRYLEMLRKHVTVEAQMKSDRLNGGSK